MRSQEKSCGSLRNIKSGLMSSIRFFKIYLDLENPSIFHEREVNFVASKNNFELSEEASLN